MARRYGCPKGHTWLAELPAPVGDSTGVLPHCPKCDELGEPLPEIESHNIPEKSEHGSSLGSTSLPAPSMPSTITSLQGVPRVPGYDELTEIGRGGMGVVYRAIDLERGGYVAIKSLLRADPNKLLRFKQEFRAVADLAHPNLVTVHELIRTEGHWCLVMDLIDGVPFTEFFHRIPDPEERLRRLRPALAQLVEGLSYLHGCGLLHCDVKPTNVLISPTTGRVVLLDFGLVTVWRESAPEEGQRELVGSLGYIAPERFAGKVPTTALDWYSVGVILFETFAGRRPFEGTRTNLIWQQRYMEPPLPSEVAAGVPAGFDTLCVGLLEREPERRFGEADLRRFLADEAISLPTEPRPRDVPLVGRDQQLRQLNEAFVRVRDGRPVLTMIQGDSGMGKSSLIDRFLGRLVARDEAVVLRGRCYERESLPFKGLDELIDSLCLYLGEMAGDDFRAIIPEGMATLSRMFPVLRRLPLKAAHWRAAEPVDPAEMRRQAQSALRHLLTAMARIRPVIVAIDDVQWIDADSLRVLAELFRSPPTALFVFSHRSTDSESMPAVRELLEANNVEVDRVEIEVGPLTPMESSSLAHSLLADVASADDNLIESIARESRGWPVFIHQLANYAREQLRHSEKHQEITLHQLIHRRMSLLSPASQRLLELLAIAAQPVRQTTLLVAAGAGNEWRAALAALRAGHWIRTAEHAGHGLAECFHDCIRDAATATLPAPESAARHDDLARALNAVQPQEHAWLAAHLLGAGQNQEAGRQYSRAALDAEESLAFDRAAQFLRLGLDLATWTPEEETLLRRRLANALACAGRGAEAAQVYLQAAREADPTTAARLRREAAFHFCSSGHPEPGLSALRDALRSAGLPIPPSPAFNPFAILGQSLRLRMRGSRFQLRSARDLVSHELERVDTAWSATAGLSLFDVANGAYYQFLHLRHALNAGEPQRLIRALSWQAVHDSASGKLAHHWLESAHCLESESPHPYSAAFLELAEGIVRYNLGRGHEAVSHLWRANEQFRTRCIGASWERTVTQIFLSWSLFQTGDLFRLSQLAVEQSHLARDRGDRLASVHIGVFALPLAKLMIDEPREGAAIIADHLAEWSSPLPYLHHLTAEMMLARIACYQGDWGKAHLHLNQALTHRKFRYLRRLRAIRLSLNLLSGLMHVRDFPSRGQVSIRALESDSSPFATAFAQLIRAVACPNDVVVQQIFNHLRFTNLVGYAAALTATSMGKNINEQDHAWAAKWFQEQGIVNPERFAQSLLPIID